MILMNGKILSVVTTMKVEIMKSGNIDDYIGNDRSEQVHVFPKFYGKVGVISWSLFYFI